VRRAAATLLAVLLCTIGSGCWDRVEIEDLAFVQAVAVDEGRDPNHVRLTMQIARPVETICPAGQGGRGRAQPVVVFGAEAWSVVDAKIRIVEEVSRRPFLSHAQAFVLGEGLARRGIRDVLDAFDRDPDFRKTAPIFVAQGEGSRALHIDPGVEVFPARTLVEMWRRLPLSSTAPFTDLGGLISDMVSEGIQPIAPRVSVAEGPEGKKTARIAGAAAFKLDRLVGWLDPKETRGVLWVRGEVAKAGVPLSVTLGKAGGVQRGQVTVSVTRTSSTITPVTGGGRTSVSVVVTAEGNVLTSGVDITDQAVVKRVETAFADAVRTEIQSALTRAKALNTDVFGLGRAFLRAEPRVWDRLKGQWDEIFPELPVDVEVRAKIRRTGISLPAIHPR